MLIKTIKAWNRKRLDKRLHRKSGIPHLAIDPTALRALLGQDRQVSADLRLTVGVVAAAAPSAEEWRTCIRSIELGARALPTGARVRIACAAASPPPGLGTFALDVGHVAVPDEATRTHALNQLLTCAFAAGSTHALLIRSDCVVEPSSLLHLLRMSEASGHEALIEGTQFPDELPKYFNPQTLRSGWASDACLLIPAKLHDVLHGFDEDFIEAGGDIDLSWRARALGQQVLTCPQALFFYAPDHGARLDKLPAQKAATCSRLLKEKWQATAAGRPDADLLARQRKPGVAEFDSGPQFTVNRW